MKLINAILIDAKARSVTAVQFDVDGDHLALVDCNLVEAITLPNGDTGWVDEEGLLTNPQDFFEMPEHYPQPIAGRCLITGTEWNDEGDVMVDAKSTVAEVKATIRWASLLEMKARYSDAAEGADNNPADDDGE